ncbi:MAG: hypothetical protein JW910_13720 [Anaerolineae bacterium]|nr:hypothetical protein [Anaerolineae bacterium]
MAQSFIDQAATSTGSADRDDDRIFGAVTAVIVNNIDTLGLGRVQVEVPVIPGRMPWARLAAPVAGFMRGAFFMPQIGDEVLVMFEQGDPNAPVVIGSLWNQQDRPPVTNPVEAPLHSKIATIGLQEIDINDLLQTITINNALQHKVTISPLGVDIETAGGLGKVSLDAAGNITIQAGLSLTLKAVNIELQGQFIKITGAATVDVEAGAAASLRGAVVQIN